MAQFGRTASSASLATVITNLVIQNVLGKALGSIWVAMNACQIIYYLPLIDLPFPSTFKQSLKFLDFANVQDDWMGSPYFYKFLDLSKIEDKAVNKVFEDYGFESSIFFFSYANKIQGWIALILIYPIIVIGSRFVRLKAIQKILISAEKMYRYNGLWRLLTELYLEMTLSAFMNIYSLQYISFTTAFMSFLALLFIFILSYLPILTAMILDRNSTKLHTIQIEERHGILYEGTRLEPMKLINQMYTPLFLFRRLIYVIILVLLKDYPVIQIFACILKNYFYLLYFVTFLPFQGKMMNFQNILNEAVTGAIFSIAYIFSGELLIEDAELYGYLILFLVLSIIGFNFVLVGVETVKGCILLIKSLRLKIQAVLDKRNYQLEQKRQPTRTPVVNLNFSRRSDQNQTFEKSSIDLLFMPQTFRENKSLALKSQRKNQPNEANSLKTQIDSFNLRIKNQITKI